MSHGNTHDVATATRHRTRFVLGVRFDNLEGHDALRTVEEFVSRRNGGHPRRVVFTNVHTVHLARKNRDFLRTVNYADLALPDGSGIAIAGRVFRTPIRENLNGTDFIPLVLEMAQDRGWSVYLLGGRPEIVAASRARLSERYPDLKIAGHHSGYFTPEDEPAILNEINKTSPDILLVGFGSPRQELWAARTLQKVDSGICFAVGGLFDFISGAVPRAPLYMRRMGLEWMFRFFHSPLAKWERVLVEAPIFLAILIMRRIVSTLREPVPRPQGNAGTGDQVVLGIRSESAILIAQWKVRALAQEQGFGENELAIIAAAIEELAGNIVTFAGRGELILRPLRSNGRRGVSITACDKGPGIPDIEQAMDDGFSTGHGLGLGLPGVKKLMDEFSIESQVGRGTTVVTKKWATGSP